MRKFINQFCFILLTLIISLSSVSCAQLDKSDNITMQEFKEKLKNDKEMIVLDVRTEQELLGPLGKIDKVINIPVQELEKRISELKDYQDREIAVICRSGNRSVLGTQILIKNGFKAKNVLGGMKEYIK
jgi:rhodanese-related sulfurtransferase